MMKIKRLVISILMTGSFFEIAGGGHGRGNPQKVAGGPREGSPFPLGPPPPGIKKKVFLKFNLSVARKKGGVEKKNTKPLTSNSRMIRWLTRGASTT